MSTTEILIPDLCFHIILCLGVPCGKSNGTNFQVNNLQPGHSYQFRVKAVNKEGDSDPLVTVNDTLAKNPFGMNIMIDY